MYAIASGDGGASGSGGNPGPDAGSLNWLKTESSPAGVAMISSFASLSALEHVHVLGTGMRMQW